MGGFEINFLVQSTGLTDKVDLKKDGLSISFWLKKLGNKNTVY